MFISPLRLLVAVLAIALYAVLVFSAPAQRHPMWLAVLVFTQLAVTALFVLTPKTRRRLLRRVLAFLGLGALAATLTACAGMTGLPALGGADQTAILNAVNAHIEGCERHYHGQTVPPSLSVQIDCPARPGGVSAAPPAAAAIPAAPQ